MPREQIAPAVVANAFGFNLARSVGPAIGGLLVAVAGAAFAFLSNAVACLAMAVTLLTTRTQRLRVALPPESIGTAIAAGLRYLTLSPHMPPILLRCLLHTVPIAAVPALMPIVARDLGQGGPTQYGLLLGAFGVGAMLGSLTNNMWSRRASSDVVLRVLSGVCCLALVAIGQSRWLLVTLVAHGIAGAVWALAFANFNIAVQLLSPRWVTGRMLATYQSSVFAGIALGSWFWGECAVAIGLREALTVAGLASLVALVAARWLPISMESAGSMDPKRVMALDPAETSLHSAAGPIVVEIVYQVAPSHAEEFLEVMHEIGRIRRRDGARAWSIAQGIDEVERWVERYEFPTWLDYLRWRERPTEADHAIRPHLARIIGAEFGTVIRMIARPPGARPLRAETAPRN